MIWSLYSTITAWITKARTSMRLTLSPLSKATVSTETRRRNQSLSKPPPQRPKTCPSRSSEPQTLKAPSLPPTTTKPTPLTSNRPRLTHQQTTRAPLRPLRPKETRRPSNSPQVSTYLSIGNRRKRIQSLIRPPVAV